MPKAGWLLRFLCVFGLLAAGVVFAGSGWHEGSELFLGAIVLALASVNGLGKQASP